MNEPLSEDVVDREQYAFQSALIQQVDRATLIKEFERKARWYAYFLSRYLPTDKGAPVLDVPCGHGNILYFLRREGFVNVVGIDIDPGRVAIAKELGLRAQQCDALSYISDARGLALIVSLDFIEHIEKRDVPSLLSKYYQALRAGGVLVLRTPVTDSLVGPHDLFNDFTHRWAANSGVVEGLLRQAGFSSVIFRDERPVPYKPSNWVRLALFKGASVLTNLWLIVLGFPPKRVWSASGWYICRKQ